MQQAKESATSQFLASPYFIPICLAFYLVLRLGVIWLVPIDQHSDMLWYYDRAVGLASGNGYSREGVPTAYWPIGWPGFLSLIFRVFGNSPFVGQITNVVLAGIVFILALRLGSMIFENKIVGRVTVLILTFYPNQMGYVASLVNEIFYTALLLFSVFVIVRSQALARLILCGIAFGVATLTKPQTIFVPAVLFAGWWVLATERPRLVSYIGKAAVVYAAIGMVILPWTARNFFVFGKFVLISTNGGATLLTGNNPSARGDFMEDDPLVRQVKFDPGREVEADRLATSLALGWIRQNPGAFAILLPQKIWRLWAPDGESEWAYQLGYKYYDQYIVTFRVVRGFNQIYYLSLIVLLALSIVSFFHQRGTLPAYVGTGYLLAIYFTGISMVFSGQSRFHFPLMPWIAMYAAWVIAQWTGWSDDPLALRITAQRMRLCRGSTQ
jgi:hypothetical protein